MEALTTIIRFFQDGGLFMYPIAVILALGVAIATERYIYLTRARAENRKVWDEIRPALERQDYVRARAATANSKAAVAEVLGYGLLRARDTTERSEIEVAMDESLMEHLPRFEKRTHYLATFANISTLLGLLGTIIGLIQAFTAVANVDPVQKADLLSASISVAMNTTAFGLMCAIPLLLMHAVLQTKTTELIDSLEMVTVRFLNLVSLEGIRKEPSAPQTQAPRRP